MIVFLNGRFLEHGQAKISVFDHGFLYGDGVYETLRTYNGEIWQLDEHLRRLQHSAKLLGLKMPWPLARVGQWIKKTVLLNHFKESRIRVTLTRGINNFDFLSCEKPTLCIQVQKLIPEPQTLYNKGVKVITIKQERVLPQAKTINLLPMILGQRMMRKNKAYEAIFVDAKGFVREGAVTNVFMVKNDVVMTPKNNILSGITRQFILKLAGNIGFKIKEIDFHVNRLYQADEVFITNALKGIIPVVRIDEQMIMNGKPGSVTQEIMKQQSIYIYKNLTKKFIPGNVLNAIRDNNGRGIAIDKLINAI